MNFSIFIKVHAIVHFCPYYINVITITKKYQIQSQPHNELVTFYQILEMSYLQNNSTSIRNFIKHHLDQLSQIENFAKI